MAGIENNFIRPFSNPPGVQPTSDLQTSGTATSGKATSDAPGPDDDPAFKDGASASKKPPNFGPAGNKRIDDA